MIEAELKARLSDPAAVRGALSHRTAAERAMYRDVYYDTSAEDLDRSGRELRLRTIETAGGLRHLLTYKEPPVDQGSGSKPEYESQVMTPDAVAHLLTALGYGVSIELTKACENYRFSTSGRDFLATVVTVPEIDGTFLELETMAEEDDVDQAVAALRVLLGDLGVRAEELTTQLYTDAVRAARSA